MKALIVTVSAVILLAGCATSEQVALQDDATCQGWGAAAGSSDYAACRTAITQKRAAEAAVFSQRLAAAGRALSAASPTAPEPVRSARNLNAPMMRTTCFSKGERVSGMNKLCFYDCLGSAHVVTQSAVSMCSLTMTQ